MDRNVQRRTVLQGVGAAAGAGGLLVNGAAAADGDRDRTAELTRRQRLRTIQHAFRNKTFRSLLRHFYGRHGFRPTGAVDVTKTADGRVVSIPFAVEHEHDSRQVA